MLTDIVQMGMVRGEGGRKVGGGLGLQWGGVGVEGWGVDVDVNVAIPPDKGADSGVEEEI